MADVSTAIPAVAAIVVGGLYAGGAITWGARLRGSGARVRDTIFLVPLPQVLSAGINAAVTYGSVFAGFALAVIGLAWLAERRRDYRHPRSARLWTPPPPLATPKRRRRRLTPVALAVVGISVAGMLFCLAGILLVLPPVMDVILLIGGASVLAAQMWLGSVEWYVRFAKRPRAVVSFAMFFSVAATAALAVTSPDPLPDVTVAVTDGRSVHGRLITTTDQATYVAIRGLRWQEIPSRNISRVLVTTRGSARVRTTVEVLFGTRCLHVVVHLCAPN